MKKNKNKTPKEFEKEIIISEDLKTITIKSHLGNDIIKIKSSVKLEIEYFN